MLALVEIMLSVEKRRTRRRPLWSGARRNRPFLQRWLFGNINIRQCVGNNKGERTVIITSVYRRWSLSLCLYINKMGNGMFQMKFISVMVIFLYSQWHQREMKRAYVGIREIITCMSIMTSSAGRGVFKDLVISMTCAEERWQRSMKYEATKSWTLACGGGQSKANRGVSNKWAEYFPNTCMLGLYVNERYQQTFSKLLEDLVLNIELSVKCASKGAVLRGSVTSRSRNRQTIKEQRERQVCR